MKNLFLIAVLLLTLSGLASNANAGTWITGSATNSFGTRNYKAWIPTNYRASKPVPLFLMLHGCSQNPDDFAAGTAMNPIADTYNFITVYPEQPSSANGTNCWNWFLLEDQTRDSGEPAIIADIVRQVKSNYSVDDKRVFVLGMSAGAAMSVIMGATYPDIFAGVGASAGLEFRAGDNAATGVLAQETMGPDPNTQGQIAFNSMGSLAHRMPTIVFHGTLDQTVRSTNGTQIIDQYAQTNDFIDDGVDNNSVDAIADQTIMGTAPVSGGLTYTRTIYNDASGKPLMEKWFVDNMTHNWSGGSSAGSYTNPSGPSASFEMCRFFGVCVASVTTAANAGISGRVTLANGKGLNNVRIELNSENFNAPRYVRTNAFGYYRFENVATGATYILSATHKRYNFEESVLTLNLLGEIQDANFAAQR